MKLGGSKMVSKQDFLDSKIAIEIHNEKDCQELLDFVTENGIDLNEIEARDCLEYPYLFMETENYLQATKSEWTCKEDKLRIVQFDKVFNVTSI